MRNIASPFTEMMRDTPSSKDEKKRPDFKLYRTESSSSPAIWVFQAIYRDCRAG
jgi:hypothetical protein